MVIFALCRSFSFFISGVFFHGVGFCFLFCFLFSSLFFKFFASLLSSVFLLFVSVCLSLLLPSYCLLLFFLLCAVVGIVCFSVC